PWREPRRGGGGGRRHPGGAAAVGQQVRGAAGGRDAAVAGTGDPGRAADPADRAQHQYPNGEEADLLDGGGQPDGGDGVGLPERDRQEPVEPAPGRVQPRGYSPGATRGAADRGDVRPGQERGAGGQGPRPGNQ